MEAKQTRGDRKQIVVAGVCGERVSETDRVMRMRFLYGMIKCLELDRGHGCTTLVHILNATELYTLNG